MVKVNSHEGRIKWNSELGKHVIERNWTVEEEDILRKIVETNPKMKIKEITIEFNRRMSTNRSDSSVRSKLSRLKIR